MNKREYTTVIEDLRNIKKDIEASKNTLYDLEKKKTGIEKTVRDYLHDTYYNKFVIVEGLLGMCVEITKNLSLVIKMFAVNFKHEIEYISGSFRYDPDVVSVATPQDIVSQLPLVNTYFVPANKPVYNYLNVQNMYPNSPNVSVDSNTQKTFGNIVADRLTANLSKTMETVLDDKEEDDTNVEK